jgi:RimJ/RimL family protein N-acetyltransferase
METSGIEIVGERVRLRPIALTEIEELWQAMLAESEQAVAKMPNEAAFKRRLGFSGELRGGTLDLAIDVGGELIGRVQTFEPPDRPPTPGTFYLGIGLNPTTRGRGYGRDAVALLTAWLFEHAAAVGVEGITDPDNHAMQAVFRNLGWDLTSTTTEYERQWLVFIAPVSSPAEVDDKGL